MTRLTLSLSLVAALCACSGGSSSTDGGSADAGGVACDALAQTGCGAGQKCTVDGANGSLVCGAAGSKVAYQACATDTECAAGTVCLNAPPSSTAFVGGQTCRPICNPSTQAHLTCVGNDACDFIDRAASDVGFCEQHAASDGGA